jgi:hypothetical protein
MMMIEMLKQKDNGKKLIIIDRTILMTERERERESKIANLKAEIQQLELIANRTTQQEQELQAKKAELARLLAEINSEKRPSN